MPVLHKCHLRVTKRTAPWHFSVGVSTQLSWVRLLSQGLAELTHMWPLENNEPHVSAKQKNPHKQTDKIIHRLSKMLGCKSPLTHPCRKHRKRERRCTFSPDVSEEDKHKESSRLSPTYGGVHRFFIFYRPFNKLSSVCS